MAQKLTIDLSGKKGLALGFALNRDGSAAKPNLRYIAEDGQVADGVYNPFRQYGYLSPANNGIKPVQTGSSSVTTKIKNYIYDEINDDFYVADNTDLWKGDTLLDFDLTSVITYTGGIVTDLDIYKVNDVRKLFTIYKVGGNMEIGISDLPYDISDDDLTWLSGTVTNPISEATTTTPFMRVADNGFAYLFQDNRVHKIDGGLSGGANGTATANVLLFPPSSLIVDALDTRGFLFIGIEPARVSTANAPNVEFVSNVGVYIWDRRSTLLNVADFIPLTGVKKIKRVLIGPEGDIRLLTISAEQILQLRGFNGSGFPIIAELGYTRSDPTGGHDTVTVSNGMIMWLGRDGYVYGYGKLNPKEPEAQFKLGRYAATASTSNGPTMLFFGDNTYNRSGFYLAYNQGGNEFLQKWYINGIGTQDSVAQVSQQGDIFTPVRLLPTLSTIKDINIYCSPTSSGSTTTATLKFYFNQSSTASFSKTVTLDDTAKGYISYKINKPYVNAVQIEIEYPTDLTLGANDFAPSFAIVEYEPTDTKG